MWFYTATPQECSGCGRTDRMVRATTRLCPTCEFIPLPAAVQVSAVRTAAER